MKVFQKAIALTIVMLPTLAIAVPKKTQPNILIFLLDDVGFGQLSSFGGPYRTPNIDSVAARGLRYTNFHTTALCSPSRAALLTGRNHHSVGMATITETVSQEPGYNGILPKSAGTLAAMLRNVGYSTYGLGKWHLTPINEAGPQGPFDRWPTSMGFEHWYGFQGAETNQWSPALWKDTTPIEPAAINGYHLTVDLADKAVAYVKQQASNKNPFFLYFATGAGHAPHHAPREYIEANKGRFDQGWDKVREQTFAKQKQLGIVPSDAVLPERDPAIKAWDTLSANEKRLFARMQEVHSGFIEQTDHEFGRILQALQATGQLDNTIIFITSDNGASGEGGPVGTVNEMRWANAVPESLEDNLAMIDKLGGPATYNHYPAGWALTGNTPFRFWKQEVHGGGVNDPMILSWPAKIKATGAIRSQFTHMIDVVPTLLAATGVSAPNTLGGIAQMPIEGVSFVQTFNDANAVSEKSVQYFEMLGNRAIWKDGWKAVAWHGLYPWESNLVGSGHFDNDKWELYDLVKDPTESRDLATMYPGKLEELKMLFDQEAKAHQVYPLDDRSISQRASEANASFTAGMTEFTYLKVQERIPHPIAPSLRKRSFSVVADIEMRKNGAQGVIVADGGRFAGYSLFIKDQKLILAYNWLGMKTYTITANEKLAAGRGKVRVEAQPTGKDGALVTLFYDDRKVGEGTIEHSVPYGYSATETFDVGSDTITPVSEMYQSPFPFTGKLHKLTITLKNDQEQNQSTPYIED